MSYKEKDTYYPKYLVIRKSNCEVLDPKETFTLVPSRDPHAQVAIKAYCDSCEKEMPGLASALRDSFGL